ncbi:MAG: hypothetical protein LBV67_07060 [Streptococcaceae bacterium]|jgi:hypothetical protein|nr:hypothetical protein [Streptococcaceae bacterium]
MTTLSAEQIELIAKVVRKEEKKSNTEKKKERKDWRLRNTNLLLKKYRMLKKHCEQNIDALEEYNEMTYDSELLDLNTLMKYKAKTNKMLKYFDVVYQSFGEYCKISGYTEARRFEIIDKLYVSDNKQSAEVLAELYNLDKSVIYKEVKTATEDLSIFLFGIDSLEDLNCV